MLDNHQARNLQRKAGQKPIYTVDIADSSNKMDGALPFWMKQLILYWVKLTLPLDT